MEMKRKRSLTCFVFGLYVLLLIWGILFKFDYPLPRLAFSHAWRTPINLVPFGAPLENSRLAVEEMLFNVVCFIPLGSYLSILRFPKRAWGRIALGLAASLIFETLQYVFAIGSADITDVILNTLGAGLGVLLMHALEAMMGERAEKLVNIAMLVLEILLMLFFGVLLALNQ